MIFLSHNSADWKFARDLCERLLRAGLDCWVDHDRKFSDAPWPGDFYKIISRTHCMVTLFGPRGLGEFQEKEIRYAKNKRIPIISIRLAGCSEHAPHYSKYAANPSRDFGKGITKHAVHDLAHLIKQYEPASTNKKQKIHILTFTGGPAAGTSAFCRGLANRLVQRFGKHSCRIISMAQYYRVEKIHIPAVKEFDEHANFDDPKVINFRRMLKDVHQLSKGVPIRLASYDKQYHSAGNSYLVEPPTRFILLHGVYVLHNEPILKASHAKFYIDVDAEVRFLRRMEKELVRYGMKTETVLDYYWRKVKPAFESFVEPCKANADLTVRPMAPRVVHGYLNLEIDSQIEEVITFLKLGGLI
jgi:uridine kinase